MPAMAGGMSRQIAGQRRKALAVRRSRQHHQRAGNHANRAKKPSFHEAMSDR
jgi:hypothetical protein